MSSEPVRTCAGCGRKAAKSELVRFVAPGGVLVPGRQDSGRGVYTCRRLQCFERARARRAFARTLRRPVRVEALPDRFWLGFDPVDRSVQTDAGQSPAS